MFCPLRAGRAAQHAEGDDVVGWRDQFRPGAVMALPILDGEAPVTEGTEQAVRRGRHHVKLLRRSGHAHDLAIAQHHDQLQRPVHGFESRNPTIFSNREIMARIIAATRKASLDSSQ